MARVLSKKTAEHQVPDSDVSCAALSISAPLSTEEAATLARTLTALADPIRIRLVSLVAAQGEVCS